MTRLRLGSVAEAVTRTAPCPVLLVREGADLDRWRVGRVLAAVDPDDLDSASLALDDTPGPVRWAADLAACFGADLDLLAVVDGAPDREYPSLRRSAAGLLALTVRLSHDAPTPAHVDYAVRQGDPIDRIVAEAERSGANLIVVGTRRRRGLRRLALGSVAEGVSRGAPCPVLVVSSPAPVADLASPAETRSGEAPLEPSSHS